MTAQVAADLRAAAEVLRRDGWTKGTYFDGRRCCQAGAVMRVIDPHAGRSFEMSSEDRDRWLAAENALDRFVSQDGYPGRAIEWNDFSATSADEVIAALEAAADAAEADQ